MLTFLYPLLDALSDGRIIRRAVVIALNVLAVLTLVAGLVGVVVILKAAFGQSVPTEATIGGLIWAAVFAGIVGAIFQIYRYHVRDIEQLADAHFVIIPIASVLLRLTGEQIAVWCVGFGVGGFILLLFAAPYAQLFTSGVDILPFTPTVAASGFLGGVWILALSLFVGFGGLLLCYLLAEGIVVVADAANQLRQLVALYKRSDARAAVAAVSDEPPGPSAACPACESIIAAPGSRFCEHCGAKL